MAKNFDKWFRAQFGPRPLTESQYEKLVSKTLSAKYALRGGEEKLASCRSWDNLHKAALYAWNAAQDGPKNKQE